MAEPVEGREPLAALLAGSERLVAFTGAGVSTESGIPDFRSPGGVWTRYDPRDFTFAKYVDDPDVRVRSWQMRHEFWRADPQPNPAHVALARLERAGRLDAVVTQNIDGLHQAAGSETVIELHGTSREVLCIGATPRAGTPDGCGYTTSISAVLERVTEGEPDPPCPACDGLLKSATVSFGQNLFPGVLEEAMARACAADLVLAVGSSLQVYPAAGVPAAAVDAGVPLAIVNDEATPLDAKARLVVRGRAAPVLSRAVTGVLDDGRSAS